MWSWPTSRAAYGLKAAKPSARVDQQNDVRVLNTQLSYDRLADEYVRRIYDELKDKPLDCQLLDQFSTRVQGNGRVCDLGCGPGHLARYLRDRGVEIFGVDLSAELVERGRGLIPRIDHEKIFFEMRRVLRPAGLLLLAFHLGDEVMHFDELWGSKVALDFYLFRCEAVADSLRVAGFEVEQVTERDPYPQVEAQTRRGYIFARRSEEYRSRSRHPVSPAA